MRGFNSVANIPGGSYICTLGIILQIHYIYGNPCDLRSSKDRVIVAALLGIHENSPNCSEVSLRGMQELAILEKVVSHINVNDGMKEGLKIDLKILDTCSTTEGATKAVLKALIMSKQTCPSPPLLLGFIGPEDNKLMEAVQQISATFEKIHIIPFANEFYYNRLKQESVFSVGVGRTKQRCKALLSITNHLIWKSVVVITDDYHSSISLNNYLTDFAKDYLCVMNSVKIPKNAYNAKAFLRTVINEALFKNADGIILLLEHDDILLSLSATIRELITDSKLAKEMSFIVYLSKIGLRPWNVPTNTFILQEVSGKRSDNLEQFYNITLFGDYQKQLINDYKTTNCASAKYVSAKLDEDCLSSHINIPNVAFTEMIDSSVLPLEYAIHLLWSAFKTSRQNKCRFDNFGATERGICNRLLEIPSEEWKLYLQKTSLTSSDSSKRISFHMDVPLSVIISANVEDFNGLTQIGHITSNGSLYLEKPHHMPPIRKSKAVNQCVQPIVKTTENPKMSSTTPPMTNGHYPISILSGGGKGITSVPPSRVTTVSVAAVDNSSSSSWFSLDGLWSFADRMAEYTGQDWLGSRFVLLTVGVIFAIIFFYTIRCLYGLFKVEPNYERD